MKSYTVTILLEFDVEAEDDQAARTAAIDQLATGAIREVEVYEV